jgi:FkbM family methyltransferase
MLNKIPVLKSIIYIHNHPLFKGSYLEAALRFFKWHFGLRLLKTPIIFDYVEDLRLVGRLGIRNTSASFYVGLIEPDWGGFVLHYLREDDTFYDVGANVGAFTLLSSSLLNVKTIAFEPLPETFSYLEENIDLNTRKSNLTLINSGIGSKPGELSFTKTLGATNHVATDKEHQSHQTLTKPITTIDLESIQNGSPTVIKIDVEGFETNVIKGAKETLKDPNLNVVLIELRNHGVRYNFDENLIHQAMLKSGFSAHIYNPFSRQILTWKRESPTKLGDIIYIRDLDKAQRRVESSKKFLIRGTYL